MVVCLLTIQVLTPFWNNDPTMTYMFNLLVGGTVSFMVVIEVCRPMNWIRRTMTVILICLFALGIMLFPGLLGILFDFPLGMHLRRSHDLHGSGDFQNFHAAGASGLSAERLGCHEDPGPDRQREGINRLLLHMLKRKDMQEFFFMAKVVVGRGHGGSDPGAVYEGRTGKR